MEKRKSVPAVQAENQVERMRKLYSRIGEPLPVDVIIDLYRHLDGALQLAREENDGMVQRKKGYRKLH